jgi:SAM-dependent methyltransferase
MPDGHRANARRLCDAAISRGEPLAWFDELYSTASGDAATIPWADLEPNPNFVAWHRATRHDLQGKRCLKVGCGLGDDCEYMQAKGGIVTGFDISPTAIEWCRRRFPESNVTYSVADLFNPPKDWLGSFDFVLESYTLQVLPHGLQKLAVETISEFVVAGGTLLVICRARDDSSPRGEMPWPLTRSELSTFESCGLSLVACDEYDDHETPPVHRIRATYKRDY